MGDIELPDDDPVQCGSEFCVICNELAIRNSIVEMWTVINWTVITNRNPNRNRSLNPVLTVHISTKLFHSQFATNNTKFAPTTLY